METNGLKLELVFAIEIKNGEHVVSLRHPVTGLQISAVIVHKPFFLGDLRMPWLIGQAQAKLLKDYQLGKR